MNLYLGLGSKFARSSLKLSDVDDFTVGVVKTMLAMIEARSRGLSFSDYAEIKLLSKITKPIEADLITNPALEKYARS